MTCLNDQSLVPKSANAQLEDLAQLLRRILDKSLLGLILHGSAATAGFEAERSDLDVLAIVDGQLTAIQSRSIGKGILQMSKNPHPLEFSIVTEADLQNWTHPCRHQFHYGEDRRKQFLDGNFKPEALTDEDLAAHFTMARARGVDLLGSYPVDRLPEIPRADYLSAILSDIEWAKTQQENLSQYTIANACRTMAYLKTGAHLAKSEGIDWCRSNGISTSSVVDEVEKKLRLELGL